jgi:hypothetical protein
MNMVPETETQFQAVYTLYVVASVLRVADSA